MRAKQIQGDGKLFSKWTDFVSQIRAQVKAHAQAFAHIPCSVQ